MGLTTESINQEIINLKAQAYDTLVNIEHFQGVYNQLSREIRNKYAQLNDAASKEAEAKAELDKKAKAAEETKAAEEVQGDKNNEG